MFTEKAYDKSMFCTKNPQMFEDNCARLKYDYVEPVATSTESVILPTETEAVDSVNNFQIFIVGVILIVIFALISIFNKRTKLRIQ
jgi:hypothetical protein